jgi:hypothetical protein
VCFAGFSQYTAILSLNNINRMVCSVDAVSCEVRTEYVYKIMRKFSISRVKIIVHIEFACSTLLVTLYFTFCLQ